MTSSDIASLSAPRMIDQLVQTAEAAEVAFPERAISGAAGHRGQ